MGKIGSKSADIRLDLISCDHCKNTFSNQEDLYEINCVKFDIEDVVFDPVYNSDSILKVDNKVVDNLFSVRRVIRFHKDCLCELAGTRWLI